MKGALEKAALPVLLLVLWEATARMGLIPIYLSSPSDICLATLELLKDGTYVDALGASLFRVYSGFAIGAALGAVLGLAAGMNRAIANFFDPLISFLYPIPKIAFLSVFLMLFGLGHASKVAIVATSAFFVVFVGAEQAVMSLNPRFVWAARNMGAGRSTILFRVVLPACLPQLLAGLRVALSLAFVLLFAAEMIGAREGLGMLIVEGTEYVRFDIMFSGILAFAVLGFLSDRLLLAVRRRLLRGQMIGTEEQAI